MIVSLQGVHIPGLGTFTFSQKKLDVGNNKFILIQRPVFQLAEKFAQTHGLNNTKLHTSGNVAQPERTQIAQFNTRQNFILTLTKYV